MIRINGLTMPLSYTKESLRQRTAAELKVPESDITGLRLHRRSVDARHKDLSLIHI